MRRFFRRFLNLLFYGIIPLHMREWNLKSGDPLALTLAADARHGQTDYSNDQIWELMLGEGEPPALALHTTLGLRARSLRLFPRFTENDLTVVDPASFAEAPAVKKIYPNYLLVRFSPFSLIDVEAEYWVPDSKGVAGRLHFTNRGSSPRQIRLEWVAQLTPNRGQRMAVLEMQAAPLLSGTSDDLAPVVFLTGGPQAGTGSYPSLRLDLDLPPGGTRRMTWTHAALRDPEDSFNLARSIAARPWEAEVARLELSNAGLIDIHTGNPDWDAAFALSQKTAFGLFVGPTIHLPAPSYVTTRLPDQGYSLRGDGSDYNHLWNGQSPLEAYYLAGLILPSAPALAQGILRNYLAAQAEDGSIDWKPGLAGQRSRLLATPLLASLTWKIYEFTGDKAFLEETFPGLWRFVQSWFRPEQDRDGDGIPEWNHPMQTGFDDHPTFSRWHPWSQGVDITTAESPALCAFLYRECQSLLDIAGQLDRPEPVSALHAMAEHLRTALETSWDMEAATYRYWDRDSHYSTEGEKLGERTGPGPVIIERTFEHPVRLLVRVQTSGEATRPLMVILRGEGASGQPRLETVGKDRFKWFMGVGIMTGERVYSRIEQVDLQGLEEGDRVQVFTVGYRCLDQTTLLPLWACAAERDRAEILIQQTILSPDRYWMPYGIPACPGNAPCSGDDTTSACQSVHLPWNTLIGEGLLRYGFQAEAAEIVTRVMAAIVQTLKQERGFRRYYHAETGQGYGDWNALSGLAPMGLFMETLGVRLISPQKVALQGFNPFPWPITVKYRGITILRQKESSTIIFPDGQTVEVEDPAPRVVSLERI